MKLSTDKTSLDITWIKINRLPTLTTYPDVLVGRNNWKPWSGIGKFQRNNDYNKWKGLKNVLHRCKHICKATSSKHRPKACKRASIPSTPKEFQKYFSNASKKIKHPTQADTTMTVKPLTTMVYRHGGQERQLVTCVWRHAGVKCLNSSSVFQINFSVGLTVLCPEIPHERQTKNVMID